MSRPRDWHPLRGSDPVGGDPVEIAALARRYADTAQAINEASTALRRIHDSATAWDSDAGRAFRDRTSDTAGTIAKAFDRYDKTASALSRYAGELESVQSRADALLRQAQADDDERSAASRARLQNASTAQPDPHLDSQLHQRESAAAGRVDAARGKLEALHSEWDGAGNRAANAIEDVTSGDGLDDSWWDDVLDVVSAVTDIAGKLSAVFGVISLICSFVPFLQPLAAVFGALALITGVISLAGHLLLYANGRASLGDVLWDVVGVASFGAGRAFSLAGKAVATGARGLAKPALISSLRAGGASARQASRIARARGVTGGGRVAKQLASRASRPSGIWPTRAEWVEAYRPSSLFREVATGGAPALPGGTSALPEVSAALRRSRVATRIATGSGVVGNVGDAKGVRDWVLEGRPSSPVQRNR